MRKVYMAKRRGSEIFNFVVCRNLVCLGDLECLFCVHNVVCVCMRNVVCVS